MIKSAVVCDQAFLVPGGSFGSLGDEGAEGGSVIVIEGISRGYGRFLLV